MTVSYSAYVATSRGFPSCFVKLLRRWVGSIYKLIYCELLVFLGLYYLLNMSYRFLMTEEQQDHFANVVSYFSTYNKKIPITFVLGFYVSIVVGRWYDQIWKKPWPDPVAVFVSSQIRGNDERGRKMRRTVMRYLNLCYVMVFCLISPGVKKRFPTYDHLVDVGILVENEKRIIMAMDAIYPKLPKYWMPIVWASSIFTRARKEGRIRDDFALRTLNDSINDFRQNCIMLIHYNTISIPLVYTQVVTLAVYLYFFAAIIGHQWIREDKNFDYSYSVKYYFPLFVTLEFFFLVGWLKVAETLICPFGEDDDDFEINATIDRNIQISYIIVDEMHNRHPQLIKDQYWDEVYPYELQGGGGGAPPPHSTAKLGQKPISPKTSTTNLRDSDAQTPKIAVDDSEKSLLTVNEMLLNAPPHPVSSTDSFATMPSYFLVEELSEEDEGEGPEPVSKVTFEQLREERERQKIARQQQKVQRTVENVADMTGELPMHLRKRQMPTDSTEKPTEGTEDDNKTNQDSTEQSDSKKKPDNDDKKHAKQD